MPEGRKERKVVTVLFADLVDFTSRSEEADPEDVAAELARYHAHVREVLRRYDGTVEKFIGDAAMAVLGAPIAHEDDPERAVRAGLEIRDWALEKGLEVRIGVNSGEALVTVDARAEAGETLVAGDVVNTAARLQTAAPVNGVLVGEGTHRATERAFEYRDAEPVHAKGKSKPVDAWEALEAKSRLGVDVERSPSARLVGRQAELGMLRGAFDRARGALEPQLVTLVGVPGIGKSRLVYELMQTLHDEPDLITWRQGRCLPYGEGVTFWALGEIVKAHAGILESDSREAVEQKLRETVGDPRLVSHLGSLVGMGGGDAGGGDRRSEAFAAWREFFEGLAESGPLVLVIEDVHWADDDLLDFVDHLVDWARGVPILTVLTARPELLERRPGWGGGKSNALTISLSPLTEAETAQLVTNLLNRPDQASKTQTELLSRAGGNPLYAEQYARILAEGGDIAELPETVQGIVAARLDLLEPDQKALLQDAAVLGKTFWSGGLATVSGLEHRTIEDRLHGLERRDFVRRERRTAVADETQYAFIHVLARDVAYAQLPRAERADRHRRAAGWIESLGRVEDQSEMLAHHYLSALELTSAAGGDDPSLVDKARAAVRDAGDRALRLNAYPAAARFYSQALELSATDDPDRPELLFRLGQALHKNGDPRAEPTLEEAANALLAQERIERAAEAYVFLSEQSWDRGNQARATAAMARAHDLLVGENSEIRARVLASMARQEMLAGRNEDAVRTGREALPIAEELGLDDVRSHLLNSIGSAHSVLGEEVGRTELEESLEVALAIDSPLASISYNNLGVLHLTLGDVRRDRELREASLRVAERFGIERDVRFMRAVVLLQHGYYAGEWKQAAADADEFIAECEAGSPHYLEPMARAIRALIWLGDGAIAEAAAQSARAEQRAREVGDPQVVLSVLAARLHVAVETGDDALGQAVASEILAAPPRLDVFPPGLELAWAASELDIAEQARNWIDGVPTRSKWNDACRLVLADNLGAAGDLFNEIGCLADEARARLRAGDAENVEKALEFYRRAGATGYIREAEALLAND